MPKKLGAVQSIVLETVKFLGFFLVELCSCYIAEMLYRTMIGVLAVTLENLLQSRLINHKNKGLTMSIQQAIKEALVDKSKVIYTGTRDLSDSIVIHSKD